MCSSDLHRSAGAEARTDARRRREREPGRSRARRAAADQHALRADRAVNVRGVAEHEAAPLLKACGRAVMDAIGRKPRARPECDRRARFAAHRRHDVVEREAVATAQLGRHDADDAPVIGAPPSPARAIQVLVTSCVPVTVIRKSASSCICVAGMSRSKSVKMSPTRLSLIVCTVRSSAVLFWPNQQTCT